MALKVLNPTIIDNAKPGPKGQKDIGDAACRGLSIRVSARRKSWCFTYPVPGTESRSRLWLGEYPGVGIAAARIKAEEARLLVQAGKDPKDVAVSTDKTIKQLIEDRMRLEVDGKLRSAEDIRRFYDHDVIPLVGSMLAKDFRGRHMNLILDPILERESPGVANQVFKQMRRLFNFAVERDELDFNPIPKGKKLPAPEVIRTRWLKIPEVQSFWGSVDFALAGVPHAATILKLALCLGQRLSEVAGMTRAEIDSQKRLWTIPKERSKNKHEHIVPLNDLAWLILSDAMRRTNGELLFPSRDAADKPLSAESIDRAVQRAHQPGPVAPLGRFGTAPWRPHDLRRTVATHMSLEENGLDIPDFHISMVLNHRSATAGSVTHRVYIQNTYVREKKDALDKWGNFLAKLVGIDLQQKEAA